MHRDTTRWDILTRQRQHNRILQLSFINDDGPEAELLINRLEASEALSRDFCYTLELLSNDADIALKSVMGKLLCAALTRGDGTQRYFTGYVDRFSFIRSDGGIAFYEARLVPWLAFLKSGKNNRVFHRLSLEGLSAELFSGCRLHAQWDCRLRQEDPIRTAMFQFDESDSNMLHRRWEEAGWHYHYEHDARGHRLMLSDDSTYALSIDGDQEVPFQHHGGAVEEDGIAHWSAARQFQPASVALTSYDFKTARAQHVDVPTLNKHGAVPPVEYYEYTGAYGFSNRDDGDRQSRLRMEEFEAAAKVFEGAGNCRYLQPGRAFRMTGHFSERRSRATGSNGLEEDQTFLVVSVDHSATNNYLHHTDAPPCYTNRVTCIRSGYAYNESVSQCIGHAVCTQPCIDQLTSWISDENLKSPRNLYGRALLYNQADIIAATEPHLKGSDIQFENVLNIYKGALARLQDPMQKEQLIDRLALTTANVIGKSLSETSHNVLAKAYLYILADGKVRVEKMTRFDLAKWAIAQAKEQGVKLDSQRQQTRADARTEARRAVNYAKANPSIDIYELDIGKLEREGRIAPGSIKGIGIPGVAVARRWLGSSSPPEFRLGIVTILIQLVALNFAMKDLANNDQFNEEETTVKATVAILSLGATIVETVAVTVEKSVEHPLAAFIRRQWSMDVERVKRLALQARLVGALAGIGAASYDIFINTPKAYREGNKVLAGLYFSNGVLAARIAAAGFFSLGTLFWPLLLISIGIGIAIALVNNSQLKTWLSRCEFSVGEKYVSFDAQLKGYHDAMGA